MNVDAKPWYPGTFAIPSEPDFAAATSVESDTALPCVGEGRRRWTPGGPSCELTRRHNPYSLHLSAVVDDADEGGAAPGRGSGGGEHTPPMSVDGGLDELAAALTQPLHGAQKEAERQETKTWADLAMADTGTDYPPHTSSEPFASSAVAADISNSSISDNNDNAADPTVYAHPDTCADDLSLASNHHHHQQQQQQQRERQRLYAYQQQQQRYWESYHRAFGRQAALPLGRDTQEEGGREEEGEQQQAPQEQVTGRRVLRHTHDPYKLLLCSEASGDTEALSGASPSFPIGVSSVKQASWPSSSVLRDIRQRQQQQEQQQQQQQQPPSSRAPLSGPSSPMIPAPKSKRNQQSTSETTVTATTTTTATAQSAPASPMSYIAAVVGGARTSIFQSTVPAALVPLPRSKRTATGDISSTATNSTPNASPLAPVKEKSLSTSLPICRGSHSHLSDILTTSPPHDSDEATAVLSGTATTRTEQPTSSSRCSVASREVEVACKPLQQRQQQQIKNKRKSSRDEWVVVRAKNMPSPAQSGKAREKSVATSGLFHTSMFDMGKRKDSTTTTTAAKKAKEKDQPPTQRKASAKASAEKEAKHEGKETAAVAVPLEAVQARKESLAQAKRRKAQLREEEAALLARLAATDELVDDSAARDKGVGASASSLLIGGAAVLPSALDSAPSSSSCVRVVNIPLVAIRSFDDLLLPPGSSPTSSAPAVPVTANVKNLQALLQRSLTLDESASAKAHLLQRGVTLVTDAVAKQAPALACAVLLEAGDCFMDLERSLQCCHRALRLAETNGMALFEMLARLSITRTLARVIDTSDAQHYLLRAAELALTLDERPAMGWIALQLGITLELCGHFTSSLAWYTVAGRLAKATGQSRLLCDVLCCQAIAYYAVGETSLADMAHAESRCVLHSLPRCWHQRPLQNFVQLKLQAGDMAGALAIHHTELAIAKEHGDAATASRCLGSIALANKYLGRFDEAAAVYLEELASQHAPDARQVVESLTGAASCFLLGGHTRKARDYCLKAVRHANASYEQCTVAKALLELAEVELHDGELDRAREHVVDALDAMSRVDPTERKQYLVKATLCELEWRCCSTLQRVAVSSKPPRMLEALLYSDLCNVPNTANVHGLLRRRADMYRTTTTTESCARGEEVVPTPTPEKQIHPASYLTRDVVSEAALIDLLSSPAMRHRKLVCYSLPWTEESICMAFVVSLSPDSVDVRDGERTGAAPELSVVGVPLSLSDEVICLLTSPNALNAVFDAPMETVDTPPKRLYGDTPLWPQHYSKIAFTYGQDLQSTGPQPEKEEGTGTAAGEGPCRLHTDAVYCLQVLYDALLRPIEGHLRHMGDATGVEDAASVVAVKGLTFVADGVFSRIPFHALHDGEAFLTTRYSITTCSSLSLLCMLHQAQRKQHVAAGGDSPLCDGGTVRVLDVSAVADNWQSASAFAQAAATRPQATVEHIVVDAAHGDRGSGGGNEHGKDESVSAATPTPTTSGGGVDSPGTTEEDVVGAVGQLLGDIKRSRKDKTVSNALYTAVHAPSPSDARPLLLELRLPVVPEVREDFCGFLTSSDSSVCVGHSLAVAHTWDLHRYALVLCAGCGTYSGLSIHETGIPVYRSLQYAGAPRMLLPVGNRLPSHTRVAVAAARHALSCDQEGGGGGSIADAIQAECCRCIEAGVPLRDWAAYTLCGIP